MSEKELRQQLADFLPRSHAHSAAWLQLLADDEARCVGILQDWVRCAADCFAAYLHVHAGFASPACQENDGDCCGARRPARCRAS
jgi:hypothetical protein